MATKSGNCTEVKLSTLVGHYILISFVTFDLVEHRWVGENLHQLIPHKYDQVLCCGDHALAEVFYVFV